MKQPEIPKLKWNPRNLDAVQRLIEQHFPDEWRQASQNIEGEKRLMGITGVEGLTTGRVSSMRKIGAKGGDEKQYETVIHQQNIETVEKTKDFLKGWGETAQEKADAKSVADYWDNVMEVNRQQTVDPTEYEKEIAKATTGIWRDIKVLEAKRLVEQNKPQLM